MKLHTTAFKEQIKEMGRELDSIITYGDTVLGSEQLNAVTPSFQSSILKSAMKQLDIDSNVPIPIGTILNYKFGVKINEEYEYIDFGNYIVKEIEKQEDTMSYKITCYDKMLLTMKDYVEIPITYPITIRNYINSLCIFLGLSFANKNDEFANYDKEIPNELYLDKNGKSLGYTFRDVFDELAQVTASTICINNNDEVEVRYITDTEDTIDEEYLKNINVNFGEKYGKVNSIVLSRSGESDNIYLRDETSVEENGLTELKIVDNQIMNFNNRADYLPDILEKLNGLEYYINDFSSTGVTYYDICDRYNVKIGDIIYSCVMFNDEILITQGLEENIFTEIPEETETDYKKASKTDRLINQTYLIVDKQVGEIRGVVEAVETTVENITTTTQTSKGGNHLYLEDAMESNALEYIVEGKSEQDGTPTPDTPVEIKTVKGIRNLCDGINQNYYLNIAVDLAGLATGNNGLVIPTNGKTTFTISTNIVQERYRVACINNLLQEEKSTTTAYNGVNKDGTNASITIDTTGYSYLIINATNLDSIMIEEGSIAHDYVPYGSWLKVKNVNKNLIKFKDVEETTRLGVNYSVKDDVITLNGTSTANYANNILTYNNIYLKAIKNEQYTLSFKIINGSKNIRLGISFRDVNGNQLDYIQPERTQLTATKNITAETINNTKEIRFYVNDMIEISNLQLKVQLEKNSTATEYEFHKEQSTLIDMNKPNLFDKDNANILNAYFNGNTGLLVGDSSTYLTYIPCKPNTTYNIQKIISSRFAIYISADIPKVGGAITYVTGNANVNNLQFTTNSDANYLIIYYYKSDVDTLTEQEILDSIKIYEGIGTDDYYELSSIVDTKDILTIQNKQATINQKMGKIVLDGVNYKVTSKSGTANNMFNINVINNIKEPSSNNEKTNVISTHFVNYYTANELYSNGDLIGIAGKTGKLLAIAFGIDSSINTIELANTFLSKNPVTVYYELAEPQTIELGDFPIMLYNDINNVELISELNTTTQITYLRNTPLSNDYATNQRVDKTDSDLETTNNSLNQTKQDVENTAVDLHNNYYDKEQIDSIITTTEEEITTLKQTVETNTSSTNLQISVIEEQLKNGITTVKTETGYTFDKNGLNISKTGSEMSSTLDNDGLSVKRDNTEVLTVRSAGVETENLKVRTYFTIGSHTRVEDYGNGTGFFHIGGV